METVAEMRLYADVILQYCNITSAYSRISATVSMISLLART